MTIMLLEMVKDVVSRRGPPLDVRKDLSNRAPVECIERERECLDGGKDAAVPVAYHGVCVFREEFSLTSFDEVILFGRGNHDQQVVPAGRKPVKHAGDAIFISG